MPAPLHACVPLQIQLQKRKVLMLQQQADAMKCTLTTTRATMGGVNSVREKAVALAKQITILENRLEKQYVKYNEVRRSAACERRQRRVAAGWDVCRGHVVAQLAGRQAGGVGQLSPGTCTHVACAHTLIQAVTQNKQLREQIDNLRRERMMFEAMDSQLDRWVPGVRQRSRLRHAGHVGWQ